MQGNTPSDFSRGIKFGMGCALGAGLILALLLLGASMCAGEFQRRMLEQMKEQMKEMMPPEPPPGSGRKRVNFQPQDEPKHLLSFANSRR